MVNNIIDEQLKNIQDQSFHPGDILKNNELEDYLMKVLGIQFEPFSSLRVVSHHHLYEKYKDKCKVILDGSGGDEIAAGYRYHSVAWYLDMLKGNNKQLEKKFLKLIQQHETLGISDFIKGSLKRLPQTGQATEDGELVPVIRDLLQVA